MASRLSFLAVLIAVFTSALGQAAAQTSTPVAIASGFGVGAYRPQSGVTDPVAIRQVEPRYTSEALRARIQGEVHLEAIILTDGKIGPVRVLKSLDQTFGLDDEAIKAAQQWLFRPGMVGNKPVPVVVTLVLEYRVRDKAPQAQRPPTPPALWMDDTEFLKGVARLGDRNLTMPVVDHSMEPKYTAAAMRAKIAGTVTVDMVVAPDGSVARARIARSLDPSLGLDQSALDAAMQWRFKPGVVNGLPAYVLVTATMEFRLH